jgi:hypothetical protein
VQAKAGPLLGKLEGGIARLDMRGSADGRYLYEPGEDVLAADAEPLVLASFDLLADVGDAGAARSPSWLAGLRTGFGARYADARIAAGGAGRRSRNLRAGPTLVYSVDSTRTLALFSHWYVDHPYRAHGARARRPNLALAFLWDLALD